MKRKRKMHSLPFDEQLEALLELAGTRRVGQNDRRYLQVYPDLLRGIQGILPLDRPKLMVAAHAIFGWMPTGLRVTMKTFDKALAILQQNPIEPSLPKLKRLAETFKTIRGKKSVVAASKILHFIDPERFPIWDSVVAARWGLPSNGDTASANYHGFIDACRRFAEDERGKEACEVLRLRLPQHDYNNQMTRMRLIELILFLPPR